MNRLVCKEFSVCCGTAEEIFTSPQEAEYVVARTDCRNTEAVARLIKAGFCFHDRRLKMEIRINRARQSYEMGAGGIGIAVEETRSFPWEMFEAACVAFDMDRRFHLDIGYDRMKAAEVIEAAIERYVVDGARIFRASYQEKVLGCILIMEGDGFYQNVLGFTRRDLTGKAAAHPLYTGVMSLLGKGRYIGMISSANAASINLHAQLGARVTEIEDCYILRRYDKAPA